ncbi:MAG: beta-propeller fold lactonase family protein [Vicinamibacterales bacterium]
MTLLITLAVLSGTALALDQAAAPPGAAPRFQVDPTWPAMPPQWILGQVSGVAVDARDHVWIVQRPWSLNSDEVARNPEAACCTAAPPVMEFDPAGNYVQGWGGPPADGAYEWPADEHGIHVDYKGNVWVSSAGGPRLREGKENFLLKFTRDGRFLLQIGRRGMSQGSRDTRNLNNAADIWVHPATNEVFVADGYINRRVVVFDADTGAFKRMWGAYGEPPDDEASNAPAYEGPAARQFNTVHGIKVSNDGLVYVNDRLNNRIQVFTIDGTFQREVFIERATKLLGTSFNTAFSPDPAQRWLYVADAGNGRVHILDRQTLVEAGGFGRIGHYAGQFVFMHNLAADSRGNLYVSEVGNGRRVQKFVPVR